MTIGRKLVLILVVSVKVCEFQIFQEVPVGLGMGMPMIGMGMPMPMQYPPMHLVGNPFDNQMEIEYSPITQLVSSIAHLVEMHQRSKENDGDHAASSKSMFPELAQLGMPRGNPRMSQIQTGMVPSSPRFNLIPYSHEGLGGSSTSISTSKLINSIPNENIPSVMWRIGDLIGRRDNMKEKENLYDMSKIKGFPITKSSEDNAKVLRDETPSNKSWTILEIARKVLGVDELPTAREGNAIAQLIEEVKKEREPPKFSLSL